MDRCWHLESASKSLFPTIGKQDKMLAALCHSSPLPARRGGSSAALNQDAAPIREKGISSTVMDHFDTTALLWGFGAIQALGLATAWLARVSEGSDLQPWFQRLFLFSLLVTGAATMFAPEAGGGYWLLTAATLGLMILVAVCDFRQTDRAFTV